MHFDTLIYLFFLSLVTLLFWRLPHRFHKQLLLLASYVFYMSWLPAWGLILAVMTAVNYLLSIRLAAAERGRRGLFVFLLFFNLGILVFYKYTGFILENYQGLLGKSLGFAGYDPMTQMLAPIGISFITFGFIHYGTEVYRGHSPVRNWIDFAIYAAFFPALICGPIKRYDDFIPQLSSRPMFQEDRFIRGLWLLARGMFKKIVLADSLNDIVAAGFGSHAGLGIIDAWIVVIAFALQIYFDFSGYTDMARGSAALMGYRLPENFRLPYLAANIADFWRRWHMTLSFWFRDYLYIPLGGNRCSRLRNHMNLLITMILVGLWHGAAWTYVLWGFYHGIGMIVHREWRRYRHGRQPIGHPFLRNFLAAATTFGFVLIGWIFFRANTLTDSWAMLSCMTGLGSAGLTGSLNTDHWITLALIGLSYPAYLWVARWLHEENRAYWIESRIWLLRAGWAALMLLAILAFPGGKTAFIYFEF
jgi:D-alanyl-lipoteichoic acid acyltransferase DltB (MBOAT superfamily)